MYSELPTTCPPCKSELIDKQTMSREPYVKIVGLNSTVKTLTVFVRDVDMLELRY